MFRKTLRKGLAKLGLLSLALSLFSPALAPLGVGADPMVGELTMGVSRPEAQMEVYSNGNLNTPVLSAFGASQPQSNGYHRLTNSNFPAGAHIALFSTLQGFQTVLSVNGQEVEAVDHDGKKGVLFYLSNNGSVEVLANYIPQGNNGPSGTVSVSVDHANGAFELYTVENQQKVSLANGDGTCTPQAPCDYQLPPGAYVVEFADPVPGATLAAPAEGFVLLYLNDGETLDVLGDYEPLVGPSGTVSVSVDHANGAFELYTVENQQKVSLANGDGTCTPQSPCDYQLPPGAYVVEFADPVPGATLATPEEGFVLLYLNDGETLDVLGHYISTVSPEDSIDIHVRTQDQQGAGLNENYSYNGGAFTATPDVIGNVLLSDLAAAKTITFADKVGFVTPGTVTIQNQAIASIPANVTILLNNFQTPYVAGTLLQDGDTLIIFGTYLPQAGPQDEVTINIATEDNLGNALAEPYSYNGGAFEPTPDTLTNVLLTDLAAAKTIEFDPRPGFVTPNTVTIQNQAIAAVPANVEVLLNGAAYVAGTIFQDGDTLSITGIYNPVAPNQAIIRVSVSGPVGLAQAGVTITPGVANNAQILNGASQDFPVAALQDYLVTCQPVVNFTLTTNPVQINDIAAQSVQPVTCTYIAQGGGPDEMTINIATEDNLGNALAEPYSYNGGAFEPTPDTLTNVLLTDLVAAKTIEFDPRPGFVTPNTVTIQNQAIAAVPANVEVLLNGAAYVAGTIFQDGDTLSITGIYNPVAPNQAIIRVSVSGPVGLAQAGVTITPGVANNAQILNGASQDFPVAALQDYLVTCQPVVNFTLTTNPVQINDIAAQSVQPVTCTYIDAAPADDVSFTVQTRDEDGNALTQGHSRDGGPFIATPSSFTELASNLVDYSISFQDKNGYVKPDPVLIQNQRINALPAGVTIQKNGVAYTLGEVLDLNSTYTIVGTYERKMRMTKQVISEQVTTNNNKRIDYRITVTRNARDVTPGDLTVNVRDSISSNNRTLNGSNGGSMSVVQQNNVFGLCSNNCGDVTGGSVNVTISIPGNSVTLTYQTLTNNATVPQGQASNLVNTASMEHLDNATLVTQNGVATVVLPGPPNTGGPTGGGGGGGGGGGTQKITGDMILEAEKFVSLNNSTFVDASQPEDALVIPGKATTKIYHKLRLSNLGKVTATNVQLDPGFAASGSGMSSGLPQNVKGATYDAKTGRMVIDSIPAGKTVELTYETLVTDTLKNGKPADATLTMKDFDTKLTPNQDGLTYVSIGDVYDSYLVAGNAVVQAPAGTVSVSAQPYDTDAAVGEEVTFTLKVTNNSGKTVTGLITNHDYNPGVLEILNANGGTNDGKSLQWKMASLANGQSVTYTVLGRIKAGAPVNTSVRHTTRAMVNEIENIAPAENFIFILPASGGEQLAQTGAGWAGLALTLIASFAYFLNGERKRLRNPALRPA